jgi:hypothetical protein
LFGNNLSGTIFEKEVDDYILEFGSQSPLSGVSILSGINLGDGKIYPKGRNALSAGLDSDQSYKIELGQFVCQVAIPYQRGVLA